MAQSKYRHDIGRGYPDPCRSDDHSQARKGQEKRQNELRMRMRALRYGGKLP
jgi:hypothetical protein